MSRSSPDEAERIAVEARRRFGPFIQQRLNPGAVDRDRQGTSFPPELLAEASALGLLSLPLSRERGGEGMDAFTWGVTLEEVARLSEELAFPQLVGAAPLLAALLHDAGRPELAGRELGWAYSDGADAFHFRSRATPDGSGFLLEGDKPMVTGGATASAFLVYLRTPADDLQVFWVERSDPGVEVALLQPSGLRASGLARLALRSVRVGPERLLVPVDGLGHAQRYLNLRRVILAASVVGRAQGLLQRGVQLLAATERSGRRLTELANVQGGLGRQRARLEVARAGVRAALSRFVSGAAEAHYDVLGTAAKYVAVEQSLELGSTLLRLCGGAGYLSEAGLERNVRDFQGLLAGAGSQDLLEVDLGVLTVSEVERMRGSA